MKMMLKRERTCEQSKIEDPVLDKDPSRITSINTRLVDAAILLPAYSQMQRYVSRTPYSEALLFSSLLQSFSHETGRHGR